MLPGVRIWVCPVAYRTEKMSRRMCLQPVFGKLRMSLSRAQD